MFLEVNSAAQVEALFRADYNMLWEVGVMEEMKVKKMKEGNNMKKLKADLVPRFFLKVWCRLNLGKWKPWENK